MRMNIHVPDELHNRMQAELSETNWSAAAQRAFEQELKVRAAMKGNTKMNQVIERLRKSKNDAADQAHVDGIKDGRRWAEIMAEYPELIALKAIRDGETPIDDYANALWATLKEFNYSVEELGDGWEQYANWRSDEQPALPRYFEGWLDGAMAVLDEVEDQL